MFQALSKRFKPRFAREYGEISGEILRRGLGASLVMIVYFVIKAGALLPIAGISGDAEAQDYWAFYTAAKTAGDGAAAVLYNKDAFQALFADAQGLLWLYPPSMLILLLPFGFVPYNIAKAIWLIVSAAAMILTARTLTRRNLFLSTIALLSPAFFAAVFTGQLSVIFACMLAAGLYFSKTRPILAGVCLGLLTVKPQFGLLAPVFLILTGSWRTAFVAALTAAALALASVGVFGIEAWRAFGTSLLTAHSDFLHSPGHPGRITLPDLFRMFGWTPGSTAVVSACGLAFGALALVAAERAGASQRSLIALALALTALIAPYFWVYDWAIPAFAILLFVSDRPALGKSAQLAVAAAWFCPLLPYLGIDEKIVVPIIWSALACLAGVMFAHTRKPAVAAAAV